MIPIFQSEKGISEKVADYLKGEILEGVYCEGDRIPAERDMAIKLEVSRNTVREAYKILEAYGYLIAKHGRGFFIASESQQIKKMTEGFFISSNQVSDLYAIRKVLEEKIVKKAVSNSTEQHIEELEAIVSNAKQVILQGGKPEQLSEYDLQFHLYLAKMSGNSVANKIMHHLIDLLAYARTQSIQIPKRAEKSVKEHEEIIQAIKKRDVERVKKAMEYHLESVEQSIKKNMLQDI